MTKKKKSKARRSLSNMPSYYNDINERFRLTLKEKNLTIQGAAEILETTPSTVKAILGGKTRVNIWIMRLWHKRLNCSYSYIIDGK